jgi:hypothetical protein
MTFGFRVGPVCLSEPEDAASAGAVGSDRAMAAHASSAALAGQSARAHLRIPMERAIAFMLF